MMQKKLVNGLEIISHTLWSQETLQFKELNKYFFYIFCSIFVNSQIWEYLL